MASAEEEAPQFFTDDFIAGAWGLLGYGIGTLARDLDHWKLEEEEADDLTKRTKRLINSIDKKALKKLEKKYGKHLPALSLVSGVAIVFGSRAWETFQARRAKRVSSSTKPTNDSLQKEATARAHTNGHAPASGASVPVGADGAYHPGASGTAGNGSASPGVERSLSRAEVAQTFDVDD